MLKNSVKKASIFTKTTEKITHGINLLEQNNSIHVNENLVIHFSEARFYLAFHLTLSYNMKISFCYLYN